MLPVMMIAVDTLVTPFILRLKSLIRFSMSDAYLIHTNNTHGINIKEVDALIQNDMNIFIDKEIRKEINDAKDMVFFELCICLY